MCSRSHAQHAFYASVLLYLTCEHGKMLSLEFSDLIAQVKALAEKEVDAILAQGLQRGYSSQ